MLSAMTLDLLGAKMRCDKCASARTGTIVYLADRLGEIEAITAEEIARAIYDVQTAG
jgi:hypothetical protein